MIRVRVELARSAEDRLGRGEVGAALEVDRTDHGIGRVLRVSAHIEVGRLEQLAFLAVGGRGDVGNRRSLDRAVDILRGHEVDIVPDQAGADVVAALTQRDHLRGLRGVRDVEDDRAGLVGVDLIVAVCVVDPNGVVALRDDHQAVAHEEHLGVIAPPGVVATQLRAGDELCSGAVGLDDVELVARDIVDEVSVGFDDVRLIHTLDLHVRFGIVGAARACRGGLGDRVRFGFGCGSRGCRCRGTVCNRALHHDAAGVDSVVVLHGLDEAVDVVIALHFADIGRIRRGGEGYVCGRGGSAFAQLGDAEYAGGDEHEGREHRTVSNEFLSRREGNFLTRVFFFDFHEQRLLCF